MILFVFISCTLAVFGLIVFLFRPTADQSAVQRRVAGLRASQAQGTEGHGEVQQYLRTDQRGSFAFVEDLIQGSGVQGRLTTLIMQADKNTSVGTVLATCLLAAVLAAAVAYLFLRNPWIALVLAGVASSLPIVILSIRRKRRIDAFNTALPDCVDMLARALRAGHSLVAGIDIVAQQAAEPAKFEFGEVFRKQNYGLSLRDALMELLERVPSQDLKVLVTGILVQKDTGGNLAEILDRILYVIKQRIRLKGEISTHTAQGRLTGWILSLLPIVMLGLINVVNPGYSSILFTDPLGKKLLYAGVVLLALGILSIRKIVNGIEA